LRRRPERLAALVTAGGFGSVALSMGARALVLQLHPEWALAAEATSVGTSIPMLWAVLLQLMLINLALASLVLTRLLLRIRYLAHHDPLTGCLNRRALDEHLARQRSGQRYAAVLLDIDHFKRVNDEHGHVAGDAALLHIVQVLRAGLRDAVIQVPSGIGGAATSPGGAGGATVMGVCVRDATLGEKILAGAQETTGGVSAAVLGYEGALSSDDVQQARELV